MSVKKVWNVMRFRADKAKANFHKVADSIFECIQEDLQVEDIIEDLEKGAAHSSADEIKAEGRE